jgi:hypothetical protein
MIVLYHTWVGIYPKEYISIQQRYLCTHVYSNTTIYNSQTTKSA